MGKEVLPPPATFDLGIIMVAILIHFALSTVYGLIPARVIRSFVHLVFDFVAAWLYRSMARRTVIALTP